MGTAETIEELAREFVEAWGRSDAETLDRLLAQRYTHTDVEGRVWNRSSWLAYAAEPRPVASVASEDVDVFVQGDVAVVTGRNVVVLRNDDRQNDPTERALRFTQVWVRQDTTWGRAYFQATFEASS